MSKGYWNYHMCVPAGSGHLGVQQNATVVLIRANKHCYPLRTCFMVGNDAIYCRFASPEEHFEFANHYNSIKKHIAVLNDIHEARRMPTLEYNRRIREEWIPMTDEFIRKWGLHMVYPDLRSALDGVRRALDLTLVVWPSNSFRSVPIINGDLDY